MTLLTRFRALFAGFYEFGFWNIMVMSAHCNGKDHMPEYKLLGDPSDVDGIMCSCGRFWFQRRTWRRNARRPR